MSVGGELSERARLGRTFGATAEDYERGRPPWPEAAVERVAAALGLGPDSTVVDLGAGTGKLSRLLAGRFARVVAVEPAAEMRALLAARLPQVEALEGTAEQIPLPGGAADAILVGDAFHWFDGRAAIAEFTRVLGAAGGIALLWKKPDGPSDPPLPEAARALARAAIARGGEPGGPRVERGEWREPFARSAFGELHGAEIPYEYTTDRDGIVANLMSISSIAGLPAGDRQDLRARVRELIPEGSYRQPMLAVLYWTRLEPPVWCDRCGRALADGGHQACAAARALEPPRFCGWCRRRMRVQVLPAGWTATCAVHGELSQRPSIGR